MIATYLKAHSNMLGFVINDQIFFFFSCVYLWPLAHMCFRRALANALAAAPSMWTLGNAGMGALQVGLQALIFWLYLFRFLYIYTEHIFLIIVLTTKYIFHALYIYIYIYIFLFLWWNGCVFLPWTQRLAKDSNPAIAVAASKAIYELRKQWEIEEGDSWRFMMDENTMDEKERRESDNENDTVWENVWKLVLL